MNANYERLLGLHFADSLINECIIMCEALESSKNTSYALQDDGFEYRYCKLVEAINTFLLDLDSDNLDFSRQNLTTYVDIIYNFRKIITSYMLNTLVEDNRIKLSDYPNSSKEIIKSFLGIDGKDNNYKFINYTEFTETFQLLKPSNISTYIPLRRTSNSLYIEKECFWDDEIPHYLVHNPLYIGGNDICGEAVTGQCLTDIPTYRQAFLLLLEK